MSEIRGHSCNRLVRNYQPVFLFAPYHKRQPTRVSQLASAHPRQPLLESPPTATCVSPMRQPSRASLPRQLLLKSPPTAQCDSPTRQPPASAAVGVPSNSHKRKPKCDSPHSSAAAEVPTNSHMR